MNIQNKIFSFTELTSSRKLTVKIFCKDIIKKVLANFLTYTFNFAAAVYGKLVKGTFLIMLIRVSEKTMYKVAKNGKTYYDAFLFVLTLRSFHHNPVFLNFKPRLAHYRRLTGISDSRFRKLLNLAISLNLASYDGKHLHLYSFTKEKRQYKAQHRQEIALTELKPFFYYSTLKHNIIQQVSKIKFKAASTVKNRCGISVAQDNTIPYQRLEINPEVTLSVRSAAKMLDICPAFAYDILHSLKGFGLTINQNIVHISRETFRHCLAIGRPNIRFDTKTGVYSYVKAGFATIAVFKTLVEPKITKGLAYYDNPYW